MSRKSGRSGVTAPEVCQIHHLFSIFIVMPDLQLCLQINAVRRSLETNVLPKIYSLESILQPVNRLPKDIFVLIPCFFTSEQGWESDSHFPMNKPLITMTHVCQSWRNTLLSTPSLWTRIDFSMSTRSQQAQGFLRRSGNQLLDVHQFLDKIDQVEPFLSTTIENLYRIQGLSIVSFPPYLEPLLRNFSSSAPELKNLEITNGPGMTQTEIRFIRMFRGRMEKLTSLSLHYLCTNICDFNFPSLTRFSFSAGTHISVRDLTSFFERCPLLEFIQICLSYTPQSPTAPPHRRVCLAALRELRLDRTACTTGLLDHLILPKCTEMMLKGVFTGETLGPGRRPAARIHPSSIDYLPVMTGITKVVAMPDSCVFSGPNGNLGFWCFEGTRGNLDTDFFTSFPPITVSQIKELLVGRGTPSYSTTTHGPWKQTITWARGAFEVLTKVEDLTMVSCETWPFFVALGATMDGEILLPELRNFTIYVGYEDLRLSALIQCAKARKKHFRPLEKMTVVWGKDPSPDVMQEVESLREFMGELIHGVGEAPKFWKEHKYRDRW